MPRKPFIPCADFPYHLVARSNNRDWFSIGMDEVWSIMEDYLHFLHHSFNVEMRAFVLMSNHFHLIARFPEANVSAAMQYFLRETSRNLAKEGGRLNHCYGSAFFRSRLTTEHYYRHAYKYLYRNPVEAGLVARAEEYKYSTLRGLLGVRNLFIPLRTDALLFEDVLGTLAWLNTTPHPHDREMVRKALRNPDFKLAQCPTSRNPHRLEQHPY